MLLRNLLTVIFFYGLFQQRAPGVKNTVSSSAYRRMCSFRSWKLSCGPTAQWAGWILEPELCIALGWSWGRSFLTANRDSWKPLMVHGNHCFRWQNDHTCTQGALAHAPAEMNSSCPCPVRGLSVLAVFLRAAMSCEWDGFLTKSLRFRHRVLLKPEEQSGPQAAAQFLQLLSPAVFLREKLVFADCLCRCSCLHFLF